MQIIFLAKCQNAGKEKDLMSIKNSPLVKGISTGITVGTAAFVLTSKMNKGKKKLKSAAGRALESLAEMVDEITDKLR